MFATIKRARVFTAILLLLMATTMMGQAKKPIIMVVPSDLWCNTNGFIKEFNNQGTKIKVCDYQTALQTSSELQLVVAKINEMMTERGYPLKNLESVLKSNQEDAAMNMVTTSKSGMAVTETPIDKLRNTAKADIWMQVTWNTYQNGPKKSVSFSLQGIDAYTNKQIAGASGTGKPSFSAETNVLIEEAILSQIDNFNGQLQKHFDDLFENGREVVLQIKTWGVLKNNLSKEFGGKTLSESIEDWVAQNTVKGRYSLTDATESSLTFDQVRIPLYDANNRPTDTRSWTRNLQKMLKQNYQIDARLMMKGLGQAQLVLGDK